MKAKLIRESLNESSYDKEWVDDVISQVKTKLKGTVITPSQGDPKRMERVKNVIVRHIDDFPKSEKEAFISKLKNLGLNLKELGINESLNEDHKNNFEDYKQEVTYHLEDEDNHDLSWQNVEDLMFDREIEKELLDLYNDKVPPFKAADIIIDNYY